MEKIYTSCSPCGGSGQETVSTIVDNIPVEELITCRTCKGEGKISNSSLDNDLIDLLRDMSDKIQDIFEKVNE